MRRSMEQTSGNDRSEKQCQQPPGAKPILDEPPKHPDADHVEKQMQNVRMQETVNRQLPDVSLLERGRTQRKQAFHRGAEILNDATSAENDNEDEMHREPKPAGFPAHVISIIQHLAPN